MLTKISDTSYIDLSKISEFWCLNPHVDDINNMIGGYKFDGEIRNLQGEYVLKLKNAIDDYLHRPVTEHQRNQAKAAKLQDEIDNN